jgi:alcohol dehydrogenase
MNWLGEKGPEILEEGSAVASQATMRAAFYRTHGGENVIEITDRMKRPTLKDNQVLVKVYTSGVNPVDVKLRENTLPTLFLPLPKIIGSDVYGVVVARGKQASDKFLIGDKVIAMMPHVFSGWGSVTEFAAIDDGFLTQAPTNVTAAEAGSLPLIGLTVLQAFAPFVAHCKGQTAGLSVLIQGGAGGLGTFAIQYCKHELGMKVYTTCSAANVAFLQGLGADVVIDYAAQRFEEVAQGMDVVFDPMAYRYEDRTFRSAVLKRQVR